MCEREEAEGDGVVVEGDGKMIAAVVAVGKWESLGVCGFPSGAGSLIREMKGNTYSHRLRLVESAKERGIKPTARQPVPPRNQTPFIG